MACLSLKDKSLDIWNDRWHNAENPKGELEAVQTRVWFPNALVKPELHTKSKSNEIRTNHTIHIRTQLLLKTPKIL